MPAAREITRKAKSNLAFALRVLPPERRADMVTFYAFCRQTDDLADDTELPIDQRRQELERWKQGLLSGFADPSPLQTELLELRDRREIPNDLLLAVIDGCSMDLDPQRFPTWDSLSAYIWKVSCAVGLVSIRLFGCQDPGSEKYAVALGHALQLTNILRDVREDLENGKRIYLPLEDLNRVGLSDHDLENRRLGERFESLMRFEAARASEYFAQAEDLLPEADRKPLTPARIMAAIYQDLLKRMEKDGFQVFEKRYKVPKIRKLSILSKHLIAG